MHVLVLELLPSVRTTVKFACYKHQSVNAGDQAGNLLWRLENGETFHKHAPKVAVVLIGTNDLGAASCGGGESGITAAASVLVSRWYRIVDACLVDVLLMPTASFLLNPFLHSFLMCCSRPPHVTISAGSWVRSA